MIKPSLFVGSSREGLEIARAVQVQLEEDSDVEIWNEGVFGLSYGTLESLVQALDTFDFAVLVLTPDDLLVSRGIEQNSPRDNILVEIGLFMGRLGRERTFLLYPRDSNLKIPSDLAGVTLCPFSKPADEVKRISSVGPACTRIRNAIRSYGKTVEIEQLRNEVREQDKKITDQQETLEQQQDIVNKLVVFSLSASCYYHLWHIHNTREYIYRNEEWFCRQMNFLSDNGYLQPKTEPFLIFDRNLDGKNLVEVATLTPVGKFLVRLRGTPPEVQARAT